VLKRRPPIRRTIEAIPSGRRCIGAYKFKSSQHNASPWRDATRYQRNDKTLGINVSFCLPGSLRRGGAFRGSIAGISCVINRRGLPAYAIAIDPPRVCRQTLAHPLADGIDGMLRAKGDEKNERESLAASLLLSIRDDIWTRPGMSLTDCRCAWARSSLRLRRFRPFRDVRRIPRAYESTSRCLRFRLSRERDSEWTGRKLRVKLRFPRWTKRILSGMRACCKANFANVSTVRCTF